MIEITNKLLKTMTDNLDNIKTDWNTFDIDAFLQGMVEIGEMERKEDAA